MFLVIFLNTLIRLGVLSHFLENLLSLSSSRMKPVKDSGNTGMSGKKSPFIKVLQRQEKMKYLFFIDTKEMERRFSTQQANSSVGRDLVSLSYTDFYTLSINANLWIRDRLPNLI